MYLCKHWENSVIHQNIDFMDFENTKGHKVTPLKF